MAYGTPRIQILPAQGVVLFMVPGPPRLHPTGCRLQETGSKMQGYKDAGVEGYEDARIQGYIRYRMQE